MKSYFSVLAIIFMVTIETHAKVVRYELTVKNEKINLSGKKEVNFALTVNGGIPAPTLEFTEGDDAEILVKNDLEKEEVSIHWHGLLLPPEEDGVAYVNTPPIFPKKERLFKFKLRQSGTYWYHSHTAVQEQKGVYGALIIHPKVKKINVDKEAVVVISDWSDENADQIIKNLRKDGDYYLYKKNSVRSYFGAIQSGGLSTHLYNEWTRMGGMDLSDVGYDAFLINGKKDSQLTMAHPGEKIRIRIINAAASSYFYIAMPGPMTIVSADGIDTKPTPTNEILIGMAETYDVIFTVPDHKNYELRVTAQDVTGFASAWIGMGEKVMAPNKPRPNLYASMDHSAHKTKSSEHSHHGHHSAPVSAPAGHYAGHHGHHQMSPAAATPSDVLQSVTVDQLQAQTSTELPKGTKIHEVSLVLGGDMRRYVWHINGKAIHQDRLLKIKEGEIIRWTLINQTMMHHPMHFHGHFFRVINQFGERSPLKHTVDVPPHSTRTIEFYANEPGQWMLHCHNLYHMKTGMARVVRYSDYQLSSQMKKYDQQDPHLHDHGYHYTQLEAASNHANLRTKWMRTWDELDLEIETASIDGKNFSFDENWETEGDLFYRRWFSNYFHILTGFSSYDEESYGALGAGLILPMLIEAQVSFNQDGKVRFDLEKRFQWTKNFYSDAEVTWRPDWGGERDSEFEISLMYAPSWHWSAGLMFTERSAGFGLEVQF